MICPRCRAENPDSASACRQCGEAFAPFEDGLTFDGATLDGTSPLDSDVSERSFSGARPSPPQPSQGQPQPKPVLPSGELSSGGVSPVVPAPSATSRGSASRSSRAASGGRGSSANLSGAKSWHSMSGSLVHLEPGSDFGPRYRIEAMIGEGGMGAVYRAHDRELDRTVALKLLLPSLMTNPVAQQRFKQELLLASRISHKNILRIHDLGDVDGVKFISMVFIEGEDLHTVIRRTKRLPVERAVSIARQLADALDAAHSEGVVHRDLKPQNILLDQNDTVFVSDFGLAKSVDAAAANVTHAGQIIGTPRYMAPEQVESKPADHRADIYSFGLILYEMLTGESPFSGDSTLQMMYSRVKTKPKNPALINPEIPGWLAKLVMKCLEREPFRRYASAHDILADLDAQRVTGGGSSASRSMSGGTRTVQIQLPMPVTRRGWLLMGGAGLAVLALLVLLVMFLRAPRGGAGGEGGETFVAGIPPISQGKYVAVLPFRVLGESKELEHIAEGFSESLTSRLFQMKSVHVASPAADSGAKLDGSVEKIARRLGANLVVNGSVQAAGDRIRIIVELQDVRAGRRMWSQQFTGVPQDQLTLEENIFTELTRALEIGAEEAQQVRAGGRSTENIEAYDLYLKGRNALRGQHDVKNVETAIKFFEDAVRRDPSFPIAYAGLADASLQMFREKKEPFYAQRALAAAQRARELNDNLPEVHFSLGSVLNATGKTGEAIAELKRALELAPNSDEGERRLGAAYLAAGRGGDAIASYERAVRANPYFWLNHNSLGNAFLSLGEMDKALAAYRRVTELEPENPIGHENIGNVFFRQGKWQECIEYYQKALALQPYYSTYSNLGTALFFLRKYPEAVKMFEKAAEMAPNDHTMAGNLADALRASGDSVRAAASYDRAIALAYKQLEVNPRNADTLGMLALYYAKKGEAKKGVEMIRRARGIKGKDISLMYYEAVVNSLGGNTKEALRALREALASGYPAREAQNDPELSGISGDPGFQKLIKEFSEKK